MNIEDLLDTIDTDFKESLDGVYVDDFDIQKTNNVFCMEVDRWLIDDTVLYIYTKNAEYIQEDDCRTYSVKVFYGN